MKRDPNAKCDGCSQPGRWLLHNIRQRAAYRRFCTNCVLKNHQGHFCPFCLQVFNESQLPPPHQRLVCHRCPAISHLSCAPHSSPYTFVCPACADPNLAFFEIRSDADQNRTIDKDSAKALLAAARIAAASMGKAASIARAEAERRVKEAAVAKRRAKEAIERVAFLTAGENNEKGTVITNPRVAADDDSAPKRNGLSAQKPVEGKGLLSLSALNAAKLQPQ